MDLVSYFADTAFIAMMSPVAAWDSSGSERTGLYLRFGHWPADERSFSGAGGYHEEGVSTYDLDRHGNPAIDHGLDRGHVHDDECDADEFGTCQYSPDPGEEPDNDPHEEMLGRVSRAERNRYHGSDNRGETAHLVRGEMSGVGYDGEPLLKHVHRVGDWIDHRHLFFPEGGPHRLARTEDDDDYEPPEEAPLTPKTAAARPGRGEKTCLCCKGNGSHADGSECDPCDESGLLHSNEEQRYCPGQPQPRRRHWRQGSLGETDDPSKEAHMASYIPPAERTEGIQHILSHYLPSDFDTWDEVRDNNDWNHPVRRDFVDDIRRNGVTRPVPIDYEQDPPRVMNGHTRVLAAEMAGVSEVPTRQHQGLMDPDDPDHMGRQPDHPEHWTNKHPEWIEHVASRWIEHEGALEVPAPAAGETSNDYKEILGHFEGADTSYRISHGAPGPGHTNQSGTPRASIQYHEAHGLDPDHQVSIYRAVPEGATSINHGDWVSLHGDWTQDRADSEEGWHVLHAQVPARHVYLDASERDDDEAGYHGPDIEGEHHGVLDHFEAADSSLYHGVHIPPGGPDDDPEWLAPMHDVRNAMPRAYEHPRDYLGWDAESGRQLQAANGKPDHPVTVYRALPAGRREINAGDWVTTSGAYARTHGESNLRHTPWHVVKADVPARHLFNEGYMSEWGYQGPHVGNAAVHYVGDDHDRRDDDLGPREAAVDDYRMSHGAPGPQWGHKPLHHYTGEDPDDRVRIYRAAPAGTEAINSGDWVSRNPAYAHRHGYGEGPGGSDWPVYTAEVHQKHVHWDENDEDEHGYNGPEIWHPDVHDAETGELRGWDSYHDEHPHGQEAWIGSAVHMPQADHDFVHDPYEDEEDRANRLLGHAHAQGALHAAHWRGDDYDAKDDAVERARQTEAPEGHRVTMFHGHRKDDGRLADLSVKEYSPAEDEPWRGGWRMIDTEETYPNYSHQALDEAGRGHEAAAHESMSVEDLLGLHSDEALFHERNWTGNHSLIHGDSDATRVRSLYDAKADEMRQHPEHWGQLDEPIRNGSIDPVLLSRSSTGHTVVSEGGHRIIRAHQLGVSHLPVSWDPASQAHRDDWDDFPEEMHHEAAAEPPAVTFRTSKGKRQGIAHTTVNAYVGDSKVGYARMIDQGRTLDDLYVHPEHRGGGLGHALMGEVVRQFGHNPLHLYASPFTRGRKDKGGLDNDQLQAFYSQHGFTQVENGRRDMVREPEAEPRTAALEPATAVFEYPSAPGRQPEDDSYDEPDLSTAALNPPERQRRVGMVIVAAEEPVRYYHGTNAEHAPGAVLTAAEALTAAPGGAAANAVTQGRTPHVFFTTDYKHAEMYASVRAQMHGGTPHVYEVHPQGDFEPNPADERTRDGKPPMSFRSTAPLAVSTEVLEPPKKPRKKRAAKIAAVTMPVAPAPRSLGEVLATANDAVGGLWLPETPSDWGELLDGFPGFFGALADGLDLLGARLDDCPVDEHLPTVAHSMATACRTAADDATEINERVRTSFMGGVNG